MNNSETQKIVNAVKTADAEVKGIMRTVYEALSDKGYQPINQIVGYILSGDPTYITGYRNARNLISKIDRDELLEELVKFYIKSNG